MRPPDLPHCLGLPNAPDAGRVSFWSEQAHGRGALRLQALDKVLGQRDIPDRCFLSHETEPGGLRTCVEQVRLRISLLLNLQYFGKVSGQAALPHGLYGVCDDEEGSIRLKHARCLQEEARKVGQVVNNVDDKDERTLRVHIWESIGRITQAELNGGATSAGLLEHRF